MSSSSSDNSSNDKVIENILVSIRVKPTNQPTCWDSNEKTNTITQISKIKRQESFAVDKLFTPLHNTHDVYDSVVKKIVKSSIKGFHGAVIAYGQTNSGKTFTMLGTKSQPGIIPRVSHSLFKYIMDENERDFLIRVSYFEVYNEIVNDLLGSGSNLKIIEDKRHQIQIQGVTESDIVNSDQILSIIKRGQMNRKIASNNFNEQSSRSHTIFRIIIESQNKDGSNARTSFLHLVDLAGSEAVGRNKLKGSRSREGKFINKSLLTLQRIINMLSSSNSSSHIPYRDSKLTRILQNSIGGNSKVSMICTIAPELSNVEESFSTLRFATNAKKIKTKTKINKSLNQSQVLQHYKDKVEQLQKEIEELKRRSPKQIIDKEVNNKLVERFEAEIQANQRQINQLTNLIIQSDMINNNKSDTINNREDTSDFGLFRVRNPEDYKGKTKENSIINILNEKDYKIKNLEEKINELESMLEELMVLNENKMKK